VAGLARAAGIAALATQEVLDHQIRGLACLVYHHPPSTSISMNLEEPSGHSPQVGPLLHTPSDHSPPPLPQGDTLMAAPFTPPPSCQLDLHPESPIVVLTIPPPTVENPCYLLFPADPAAAAETDEVIPTQPIPLPVDTLSVSALFVSQEENKHLVD
jgi:hypothetical protein